MNYNPYDENMIIIGMAGSGKTYLAQYLLSNLLNDQRIIYWVWDYNWQYPSQLGVICHKLEDLGYYRCIYQPIDKTQDHFDLFCSLLLRDYNLILVLEEAHEYCSKMRLRGNFERIIRTGRNFGNTYIAITQRPADIHNSILSNSHHRFCFMLDLPSDVDYLKKWFGEGIYKILNAPPYHYVYRYYRDRNAVLCKPVGGVI